LSAILKAFCIIEKQDVASLTEITHLGKSPCPPFTAVYMSPLPVHVGSPVPAPILCANTTTKGVSLIPQQEIVSIIKSKPPPDVAVNALVPIYILPIDINAAVISFSACLKTILLS